MGIISTIKSLLGIDEPGRERRETNVTVEREPDASSERAVKEPATEEEEPETSGASSGRTMEAGGEPGADDSVREAGAEQEASGEVEGADDSEPVVDVKGIGPAYAGRLEQAGVETVADLAAADAEELADETDIAASRIQNWIDRAKARSE